MIEKYKPGIRTGRCIPVGGTEKLRNGRIRPKTGYREFFQLPDGREIEVNQWQKEALTAVEEDGLMDLLEAIKQHVSKLPWLQRKPEEIECYALECLFYGSYKHWKDFVYEGKDVIV